MAQLNKYDSQQKVASFQIADPFTRDKGMSKSGETLVKLRTSYAGRMLIASGYIFCRSFRIDQLGLVSETFCTVTESLWEV